uniref:Translation initiation factor IF-3 n=1 Tax=Sciadococcus taiwanensis TaxID=3028030 RepID=A0A9Y1I252_9RHOD|nr:translation initiation factor 3 [Sciadococcus taiwanensis]
MKNNRSNQNLPPINEHIKYRNIRVIDFEGKQLGIMELLEALEIASDKGLDLVLVSEKSDPPVCRIIDYGKYKFNLEKKAKEARKKQHTFNVKEVKMRYKIEEHDYHVRLNQVLKFLKAGDKVKATITFKGREIQHLDLAEELLQRLANDLKETAEIQQKPNREGKNLIMLLTPKK